jgi:hypothetical protein
MKLRRFKSRFITFVSIQILILLCFSLLSNNWYFCHATATSITKSEKNELK